MAEFVDRQRKSRERNRPAVNFTQRDDVREFAGSGIGRNYNRMMDLQSQKNPNLDQLKQARRQWNRYDKYNAGEMLGKTPQQMQNEYMGISRDLRQSNKPAYNKMYPLTGGFMDVAEKGGILGTILSQIGKMGKDGGIPTAVKDTIDAQDEYVSKTFGPHRTDIEELDFTDEYEGPWPHKDMPLLPREAGQPPEGAVDVTGDPTRRRDAGYDITASDLDVAPSPNPNIVDMDYWNWVDQFYDTHNPDGTPKSDPTVIPGGGTSYVDRFAPIEEEIVEEVTTPIASFNDSGRESGIASMMKSGLNLAGRRPYEDVYREFVESSGPSEVMVTYEDFMENYLPRIQESRGVFRAGLNSQGRR